MSNELTVVENKEVQVLPDYAILNPEIPMSQKVEVATNVANTLAPLVRGQGLSVKGLNKKAPEKEYVTVEGWEVLGTMLGIVPVTTIVSEIKNKSGHTIGYKARATLYRNPIVKDDEIVGGTVIARAEAHADKSGWQKDAFAIASMAQTRALGKAYRMGLSWIIKMAGFESTFAEDMPQFNPQNMSNTSQTRSRSKPTKKEEPKEENDDGVIEAEIVEKEEKNYDDLIKPFIQKVQESGVNVRKPAIMKQIRDSDLDIETQEELIDYVRENLRNAELKQKYDE